MRSKLLDKGAELILLQQDATKFLQERNLAIVTVTYPPAITTTTIASPTATSIQSVIRTPASAGPTSAGSTSNINNDDDDCTLIAFCSICGLLVISALITICHLCSRLECCKTVLNKCHPTCCSSSCKNTKHIRNCCCWGQSASKTLSGDKGIEMIEQIRVKPYFTIDDKDTQDRQEIRQLLDQTTTSFSHQPNPRSAPLEEGVYRDPEHLRIHQDLSKPCQEQ